MKALLGVLLISFCGQTGLSQERADHSSAPRAAAATNISVPPSGVSPGSNSPALSTLAVAKELEGIDVSKYCSDLAGKEEHSSSLEAVCEFVLNLRKKLSDVICERETKRYWTTYGSGLAVTENETEDEKHSDVVTVNVTYHDGQEYYSDFRMDGQPVPNTAPELSGFWSQGEFATMLESIFAPSSKTQFHYSKVTRLRSIPALVFDFKVAAQNNRLFSLQAREKTWFPEYRGSIWLDAQASSLLRMQLETAFMENYPIKRTKADIEYSNVLLGDGTSMVLPTNSNDLLCDMHCKRSVVTFMHGHKFRATTKILASPAR